MNKTLFNIHDVVLIVVIFEGILLASLLALITKGKRVGNLLLAGFLLMNALIAFEVLSIWCGPFKNHLLSVASPNLFYMFGFAYLLQGPILYWYTKFFIYSDYRPKKIEALHLLPAIAYPVLMYFAFYRFDLEYKLSLIHSFWLFYTTSPFGVLVWLEKISPAIYGLLCLYHLVRYKKRLQQHYSNIETIDMSWLKLITSMFSVTWIWALLTQVLAQFMPSAVASTMGIMTNYFILTVINAFVVYNLVNSGAFEGIHVDDKREQPVESDPSKFPSYTGLLKQAMEEEKPYLEPDLTLEQLAEKLSISPVALSSIINRDFKQNFFEFINYYRVAHAKAILMERDNRNANIQKIMFQSGFNSKSAANRFFKKFTGMTPSEFRKHPQS